jgi:serine/threonine-protein kinase
VSSQTDSDRVERILDVLLRLAAGDLAARAEVSGVGDNIDAVAAGVNMLAEEIRARVTAVERTAEELRHQVSERSRQLADALAAVPWGEPATVSPGDTLEERYQIVRLIGAGGMGAVHEVMRIHDGRRLALKTLSGRVDRATMARFAREAQIASELSHANLVPVLDLGVTPSGMMYLVMELVEGPSLEDERARFGRPEWALPLLRHVATGLAAIHERGIVHRDLKPANILLSRGVARIADFGIASLRVDASFRAERSTTMPDSSAATLQAGATPPSLTRTGVIVGTPAYLAPELMSGARDAKPSADVFAFGVMAIEMLAGKTPFVEPPLVAIALGRPLVRADFGAIADVSPGMAAMLAQCLAVDAEARPTAAAVCAALGEG